MLSGQINQARSIASLVGMSGVLAGGIAAGALLRDPRKGRNLGCALAFDLMLGVSGVRLNVRGSEHLEAPRPAVFAFNHQSNIDPLIVFKLVKHDFTAVGKAEVRQDPFANTIAKAIDAVLIERDDPEQARAQMAVAAERLRAGRSVPIAPEGTRSLGAEPAEFRTGVIHLAIAGQAPIVPVVLHGTGEIMPARTVIPGTVDVVVQPPIDTSGWDPKDARKHAAALREQMTAELLAG